MIIKLILNFLNINFKFRKGKEKNYFILVLVLAKKILAKIFIKLLYINVRLLINLILRKKILKSYFIYKNKSKYIFINN